MEPTHRHESSSKSTRVKTWLERAVQMEASDLHLVPGYPPVVRQHGNLVELDEAPLDDQAILDLMAAFCPTGLVERFRLERNADFSFEVAINGQLNRFRTNLFFADEHPSACLRVVPAAIPDFAWANFPMGLAERIIGLQDGLVIFTGITGSGKTTSLAMVVDQFNRMGGRRIITVEEPVEYRYPQTGNSVVTQREVGSDVLSFADGLRSGLRQDPDVILVGEIRDRETAQMVLSAAETGHLVFTSLHTRDAKGAISRFADLFPQDVQSDIRSQLAIVLRAIICQRLLADVIVGNKRHLALEVLWNSIPIASGIRQGKLETIDNYLMTRRDEGMVSFDESVRKLWQASKITYEVAEQNLRDPSFLKR